MGAGIREGWGGKRKRGEPGAVFKKLLHRFMLGGGEGKKEEAPFPLGIGALRRL